MRLELTPGTYASGTYYRVQLQFAVGSWQLQLAVVRRRCQPVPFRGQSLSIAGDIQSTNRELTALSEG
jgi:hypothetical protein